MPWHLYTMVMYETLLAEGQTIRVARVCKEVCTVIRIRFWFRDWSRPRPVSVAYT